MKKEPKYKRGRPTKALNDKIFNNIINAVQHGNYIETAARYAGINKQSLYTWMKRGREEKSGIYKKFLDAIEKAMAIAEMRAVKSINDAATDGHWQAHAWYLERKFYERWGRKDKHEISGQISINIDKEDEDA